MLGLTSFNETFIIPGAFEQTEDNNVDDDDVMAAANNVVGERLEQLSSEQPAAMLHQDQVVKSCNYPETTK